MSFEWLRDDDEAQKEDLTAHVSGTSNQGDSLSSMKGKLEEMSRRIEDIDNRGSRKWNESGFPNKED